MSAWLKRSYDRTGWSKPGAALVILKCTWSVPKKLVSTSTIEPLKQPCAAGYSGWLGVITSPIQVGSATRSGFPPPARMAVTGRQKA